MKFFAFVFVAVLCHVHVRAEEATLLDQIMENAKKFTENFSKVDSKQLTDSIQTGSNQLVDIINKFVEKAKTESKAHEGDVNNLINTAQENLGKVAANLKDLVGEDGVKKTEEIKSQFEVAYKKAAEEVQTLYKNAEPEASKFSDQFKTIFDDLSAKLKDVGNDIQKKISDAAEAHEKAH